MMASFLESILINTYNPNHDLRVNAEYQLIEFCKTSGSCYQILQLVGNRAIHTDVRQAAEIVFKNRLRSYWTSSDNMLVTPEEKKLIKTHILQILLIEENKSIKGLLADNIRTICEFDYPESWPDLIPTLLSFIQTNEPLKMFNGLLAMRKMIKRYEYKPREDRQVLNVIILNSFPTLQHLMTVLLENNSIEAAHIMRVCLKIFWSTTVYALPEVSGVNVNLWFNSLAYILQKNLPEASEGLEPIGQPIHIADRKQWPWWKLKKWTTRIIAHFIQRYGNPRYAGEEYKVFAEFFRSNTSVTLLGPVMNALALRPTGKYVTEEVHLLCMNYITAAIEMSPPYKAIKPHLDFICFQVIFPTLAISEAELALFKDDPQEFIRKVHDPFEDAMNPRVSATTLLQMLARYRQKDILPMVMPFIHTSLMEYANASTETKNYRQKDAILVAVASLVKVLRESKAYAPYVLSFLIAHVIPEFKSPVDFVRARAFWVIDFFDEKDYADPAVLHSVVEGMLAGLSDRSLPVQSACACSIRRLIETEGTKDLLRPVLPQLVSQYFRIMQDIENEAVLTSLQSIVDVYGAEIDPIAPEMVNHLILTFHHFSSMGDSDDEAVSSAYQSLDTILVILDAVQDIPATVSVLALQLAPLMVELLDEKGNNTFEYFEQCLSMMSYATYYPEDISPAMWSMCGPLLHAFQTWAYDFIQDISVPVVNYMTKGMPMFLQGQFNGVKFVTTLLQTITTTFESDVSMAEYDAKAAASLLNAFLVCSRCHAAGGIDDILPNILTVIFTRIAITKTKDLRQRLLECTLTSIYYNPSLTLQCINQIGPGGVSMTESFFNMLFDNLKAMTRDGTQRMIVLSFMSLLALPPSQLPPVVLQNLPNMFQQIICEVVLIEEEAARADDEEEEDEDDDEYKIDQEDDDEEEDHDEDDDDDDEDMATTAKVKKDKASNNGKSSIVTAAERLKALAVPEGGYSEDDDCLDAEDEAYRQVLENMQKQEECKFRRQIYRNGELISGSSGGAENDDDDDDDDEEEDYSATLPTENIDMSIYLVEAMTALSTQNPNLVQQLQQQLNPEDAARLQDIIRTADERKQELTVSQTIRTNSKSSNNNNNNNDDT